MLQIIPPLVARLTLRPASLLAIACCTLVFANPPKLTAQEQGASAQDPWAVLGQLEGHWQGAIDGLLGTGSGTREYELILEGNFLMYRHESVRLPQDKSPAGDYHRELGVFSFDNERENIVLRGFFVEGYVIRYACELAERRLVCQTEDVENGPGIRARLTLEIHSAFEFDEIYELAFPGNDFAVYFTNRWTRIPALR